MLRGATDGFRGNARGGVSEGVFDRPAFWLLAFIFFAVSVAVFGTVVHFVPMLTDAGFSPQKAGSTAALIGVAAIGGRLAVGALLDRVPPALVTAGLFLLASGGLLALAFGGTALSVPGALITGIAIGAEGDLMAFLVSRFFQPKVYGRTYGALYAMFLFGGAIGPALSGYLFDFSGDYKISLLGASLLLAIAAASTVGFAKLRVRDQLDDASRHPE